MEQCGVLIQELNRILSSLKKNPKRKFRLVTLKKKLNDSRIVYNDILKLLQGVDESEQLLILQTTKNVYGEIRALLDAKLDSPRLISLKTISHIVLNCVRLNKKHKMTTTIEIIKTLPLLIPQFNGEGNKLNSTIAALNACKTLITEDNRAVALQVILSRLEGKARSAVGDNPANVDEIIRKLNEKCKVTIAPETIVAKLNATKQNGEISKFTEQIEKLTLDLERAYISEDVPVATASRMAVKAGVKALASGVKSSETRLLLKAGQFSTLSSAVEKVTENESPNNNSCSVLTYRTQNNRYNSNNSRFANNYNRNRGNGNHQNRQTNYGRFERTPQRSYQNSNFYNRRNNGNNYTRFQRNDQREHAPRSRVFVAQSGNLPAPQQIMVGGGPGGPGSPGTPRQGQGQNSNFIQHQPDRLQHPSQGQVMAYVQRTQ